MLAHGAHKGAAGVQEMALSALASIAAAARTDFEPHLPAVLPALNHFMAVQVLAFWYLSFVLARCC